MSKILRIFSESQAECVNESWRHIAAAALIGAAGLTGLHGKDAPEPPKVTKSIGDTLRSFIKRNENGTKTGYDPKTDTWKIHYVLGVPHIGYGHKIEASEINRFKNGIKTSDVDSLFNEDMKKFRGVASDGLKRLTGRDFNDLNPYAQAMLIDYSFNLGSIVGFKKLIPALAAGDIKTALAEYKRKARTTTGKVIELTQRNADTYEHFLKPWVIQMKSGVKPISGKRFPSMVSKHTSPVAQALTDAHEHKKAVVPKKATMDLKLP